MAVPKILSVAIDARGATEGAKVFSKATDRIKRASHDVAAAGKRAGDATKKASSGAAFSTMQRYLALSVAIGGVGAALRTAVRVSADFELSQATLKGVLRATSDEMERLESTARLAGARTVFTATQTSDALIFLARAGFSVNDSISALPATLDLAAAGGLDLAKSADLASNIVSQFGLAADQTRRVADVLVTTSNNANTSILQLGQSMKFGGSIAGAMNKNIEEIAAMIGVMGNAGIQATMAGTATRQMLLSLVDPSARAKKAFAEFFEVIDITSDSMVDIFKEMRSLGFNEQDLAILFGREASSAAIQILNNLNEVERLIKKNEAAAGSAADLAKEKIDTLDGSFRTLKSAVEEAYLQMMDNGPKIAIRELIDLTTAVVRNMTDMDEAGGKYARTAELIVKAVRLLIPWYNQVAGALEHLRETSYDLEESSHTQLDLIREIANELIHRVGEAVTIVMELLKKFAGWVGKLWDDTIGKMWNDLKSMITAIGEWAQLGMTGIAGISGFNATRPERNPGPIETSLFDVGDFMDAVRARLAATAVKNTPRLPDTVVGIESTAALPPPERIVELNEELKNTRTLADDIGDSFATAFENIVVGAGSVKEALASLVQDVSRQILREYTRDFISGGVSSFVNGLLPQANTASTAPGMPLLPQGRSRPGTNVNMVVNTPNPDGFRKSRRQIMKAFGG